MIWAFEVAEDGGITDRQRHLHEQPSVMVRGCGHYRRDACRTFSLSGLGGTIILSTILRIGLEVRIEVIEGGQLQHERA